MNFQDGSAEERLDDFAYLASRDDNLGNAGNWFVSFRMGLQGARCRRSGLAFHRRFVYEWQMGAQLHMFEHHIATMFFCMDSALECTIFALNALGQAFNTAGFRDVRDEQALKKISLADVISTRAATGWASVFPNFKQHLISSQPLLTLLLENHDVSKHRQQTYTGGKLRNDPPAGFLERLGLTQDDPRILSVTPMESVLVQKSPKLPMEARPSDLTEWTTLEALIGGFTPFIDTAVSLACADAKANITLAPPYLDPPVAAT